MRQRSEHSFSSPGEEAPRKLRWLGGSPSIWGMGPLKSRPKRKDFRVPSRDASFQPFTCLASPRPSHKGPLGLCPAVLSNTQCRPRVTEVSTSETLRGLEVSLGPAFTVRKQSLAVAPLPLPGGCLGTAGSPSPRALQLQEALSALGRGLARFSAEKPFLGSGGRPLPAQDHS